MIDVGDNGEVTGEFDGHGRIVKGEGRIVKNDCFVGRGGNRWFDGKWKSGLTKGC